MDRVHEVVEMSYRTEGNESQAIAEDTLGYRNLVGTPIWLAIETTMLPIERHVVLRREARRERADGYLDYARRRFVMDIPPTSVDGAGHQQWFRVHHQVTARPERVTFAGRPRTEVHAMVTAIAQGTAHWNFTGVLIHDLNGFLSLPE